MKQRVESNSCIFFKLRTDLFAHFSGQSDGIREIEVVDENRRELIRCEKGLVEIP